MDADFSGLLDLSADLSSAPAAAARYARKAVEVTARSIDEDWTQGADRSGLHGYAASIDYEIKVTGDAIEAEIGPNLGRNQGSFGFVEDAGGGVRSAPQHAGRDALRANEPDFYRGLEIAVLDGTRKAVEG